MKKVIICLTGAFLLAIGGLRAQDGPVSATDTVREIPAADTVRQSPEAPAPVKDTTVSVKDTTGTAKDSAVAVIVPKIDDNKPSQDTAASQPSQPSQPAQAQDSTKDVVPATRELDKRWFISPLLKGQFQDFAFLEKNRKGYLSDANKLPFMDRGNASFAASAYKNLTGRLSVSADLGLSFGHVTNDNVLISQTKSKTYNLVNLSLYYHLLAASYRLQPYITIGVNDIINDQSYVSAPIGIGAKFNSRKVMVTGQITYGYAMTNSISNTTMYSMGVYFPLKSKKQKKQEKEDQSPYNRPGKDDKKDTTSRNGNPNITINITINMDSVKKARGIKDDDDDYGNGRNGRDGADGSDGSGRGGRRRGGRHNGRLESSLKLDDDFGEDDYKVDTIDGVPVVRFVVYFEFNEWGLNSKAFATVDKVIEHLRNKDMVIEIKGYTDDVGNNQYNNFLSRRRAKMVLEYMNSRGVPSDYMKAKAYGSDDPVADNKDPNQAWLNRRAEIIVHEK